MPTKPIHLDLRRRIVALFCMFGLAAVLAPLIALPALVQSLLSSRTESACLTRLGKAASAVTAEWSRQGDRSLQGLVERIRNEGSLLYCAVTDNEGRFLAHSSLELVGQHSANHTGAAAQWGDVHRVRYLDEDAGIVREYQTALKKGNRVLGTILIAVPDPRFLASALSAAEYAPVAIGGPAALIGLGAMALRRVLSPVAQLEEQLSRYSNPDAGIELRPIRPISAAARGWNRLLEERPASPPKADLATRLDQALDGFRHRKAEQILNSLPDGVAVTGHEGQIKFANSALMALLGRSDRSIVGLTMEECLSIESDHPLLNSEARMRDVIAEVGRGGDMSQGVLRVARCPLRSGEENVGNCHIWSVRDVTQQKLADQMRNQFVYSATHELRTPLANIKAYAETLSLSGMIDVDKQKEFCNTINTEATRLARFIDDLLSISRMQAGSLSLDRQVTNIERLIKETIDNVRPQMLQKQIAFECLFPEKLPELELDKDKIAVTLVNLLGNAVKYTPVGGRVGLVVEVLNHLLHVHVEDTGYGIAVEDLPKVFDKFFRSSDPRVQDETGSGLGLSLAAEVVRLHGGKLTVHSELNKGSKFTMTLPLA